MRTLTLVSRCTGDALYLSDWSDASNIWDGDVIMYTCTDTTGENIILTFWY